MEIKLPVSELKSAIAGLAKVHNRSSPLPALHHLKLSRSQDGIVRIQLTDLESYATYQFNQPQAGGAIEVLAPYDAIAKIVKGSSPTDSITLLIEGNHLTLRYLLAGRPVDQPLNPTDLTEWPVIPAVTGSPTRLDAGIKAAISNALACCSDESTRPAIMGAWLDVTASGAHYVMGTDGRHLYAANSFTLELIDPLLIPNQKLLTWSGFKDDGDWMLTVQPDHQWFQIQTDHWSFMVKRPTCTIPNWRQVIPNASSSKVRVQFNQASSAFLLDLLPKLPGKDDNSHPVQLGIRAGKLSVTARDGNCDHATTIPVADVQITGPDMAITVNRDFALKALKWGLTVMELTDELSPLVFSTQGKRLVAMPIRTESVASPSVEAPEPSPTQEPPTQPKEEPMSRYASEPTPEPQPVNRLTTLHDPSKASEDKPSVRTAISQVESIRESLKLVTRQFGDVIDTLRSIDKEKRVSNREVELIREKLRALQGVTL